MSEEIPQEVEVEDPEEIKQRRGLMPLLAVVIILVLLLSLYSFRESILPPTYALVPTLPESNISEDTPTATKEVVKETEEPATETPTTEPEEAAPPEITCECAGADQQCSDGTFIADSPVCIEENTCACNADLSLVCSDGTVYTDHVSCTEGCACEGPDFFCNDGADVFEDYPACLESCGCVGPDYVCDDGFSITDDATCIASCTCDGTTLLCDDGTEIADHVSCEENQPACGDGVCDFTTENVDICPEDCVCVDDGVCGPGEGLACPDCFGGSIHGNGCGASCSDDSQCSIANANNPACVSGTCWDACACGGDCGGTVTTCTPTLTYCYYDSDCSGGNVCDMLNYKCVCP